jgi:biopolymer transport protein ExbB
MIEMSYLEKGFVEMTSTITLCPMLGFLGTVAGMIVAFDAIVQQRRVERMIRSIGVSTSSHSQTPNWRTQTGLIAV